MLSQDDERALAAGLQNGDRQAWTTLYDAYSAGVWRYVARLIGPDAAAVDDVVQEVLLGAARSARSFDPARGTLWQWLAGIAHRQTAAWWRERGRQTRLQELLDSGSIEVRQLLDGSELPDDWLERQELVDLIRYVLAELPADYAMLLTARYLDEQTHEQIAAIQHSSVEATKSKLARARREFRATFEFLSRPTTRAGMAGGDD